MNLKTKNSKQSKNQIILNTVFRDFCSKLKIKNLWQIIEKRVDYFKNIHMNILNKNFSSDF